MRYQGHALDEIALDGTFADARHAAVTAAVTGSVGTTAKVISNGVEVSSVTVEAIKQQTDKLNRVYGVWSCGPAYRVEGCDVVIVLAGRPGRYKSHAKAGE